MFSVKKLEWEDGQYGRVFAKTPFCQYSVRDFGGGNFWADRDGKLIRPSYSNMEGAKAAAQMDFETRTRNSIFC